MLYIIPNIFAVKENSFSKSKWKNLKMVFINFLLYIHKLGNLNIIIKLNIEWSVKVKPQACYSVFGYKTISQMKVKNIWHSPSFEMDIFNEHKSIKTHYNVSHYIIRWMVAKTYSLLIILTKKKIWWSADNTLFFIVIVHKFVECKRNVMIFKYNQDCPYTIRILFYIHTQRNQSLNVIRPQFYTKKMVVHWTFIWLFSWQRFLMTKTCIKFLASQYCLINSGIVKCCIEKNSLVFYYHAIIGRLMVMVMSSFPWISTKGCHRLKIYHITKVRLI